MRTAEMPVILFEISWYINLIGFGSLLYSEMYRISFRSKVFDRDEYATRNHIPFDRPKRIPLHGWSFCLSVAVFAGHTLQGAGVTVDGDAAVAA
jgi:hypothetical protein